MHPELMSQTVEQMTREEYSGCTRVSADCRIWLSAWVDWVPDILAFRTGKDQNKTANLVGLDGLQPAPAEPSLSNSSETVNPPWEGTFTGYQGNIPAQTRGCPSITEYTCCSDWWCLLIFSAWLKCWAHNYKHLDSVFPSLEIAFTIFE